MTEAIDEPISVALWSNHRTRKIIPYNMFWHGRKYKITGVGFHHTYLVGKVLTHVFSVTDGISFFRLEFNAETLAWRLLDVASGPMYAQA